MDNCCLVALLLVATGCVKNPVTGARELSLLSPAEERRIGEEMARELESTIGLWQEEPLSSYVRDLGARLAVHSPRQEVNYRFDILDMVEPNAFALPDGHIYVSRGMLALGNAEDELAGILGHEIGHVAARHANQRFSRAAPVGILSGVTAAVVGVLSQSAAASVAGIGAGLNQALLAPHSRDQERQADKVGQELAHEAGWNPLGLTRALTTLGRFEQQVSGGPRQPSWLDSHPATPERVESTQRQAASLGASGAMDRTSFVRRLEGLLVGENASLGLFDENLFVHPRQRFVSTFPRGWRTGHSRQLAAALAPGEDAVCLLLLEPVQLPPVEVARRFAELLEVTYSSGPSSRSIGDKPAVEARVVTDDVDMTLLFVGHQGGTFQLLAMSEAAQRASYAEAFEAWFRSFDTASDALLAGVRELRMLVVETDADDTLGSVLGRHPTPLPAALVAVMNGMASTSAALPGEVLKVPVLRGL